MEPIKPSKLNKITQTGAKIKMEKFEDRLAGMIGALKNRAEREVCEYGSFKTVKENLKAQKPESLVRELTLQITPLPKELKGEVENFEKLRYLELVGEGPQGQTSSVILKRGTKDDILKKLSEDDLISKLREKTDDFNISFREDRY